MKYYNEKMYLKYKNRAIFHLLDIGFFYLLLVIIFSWFLSIWLFVFFTIFFFYYIFNRLKEAIIYLTYIEEKDEKILIKYYKFNEGESEKLILKENLKIEWYDWVKGNINAARLIFKNNNKIEFVQYSIGKWNRKELEKIYQRFEKL